jgi:gliding-associated putative ABC transporter substrate-binding component GldG
MSDTKSKGFLYNWSFLLLVIVGLVFVNVIGSIIYFRWDATEDKRYSLAEGTENYLSDDSNFPNRLSIKIYLEGNLPAEIKRYKNAIEDKLKEFKQFTGNRLEYTFVDPMDGTEEDQQSLFETIYNKGKGIVPMEVMFMKDGSQNQMMLWPGAEIDYEGSTVNYVQLLPGTPQGKFYTLNQQFEAQIQNSINNLEYMLLSAIRRATQKTKPRIAFLQGHGELTYAATQRVRTLISPYYTVQDITLNDSLDALKGVKGLVIARPTKPFSEKDKYIIDQFLMRGGRLMCFIDKLVIPEDTLNKNGYTHTTRNMIELDKMLFDYGVKVNDNLVFDVQCAPKAIPTAKQMLIPWFFAVRSTPTSHPIARNIDPVLLQYTSQIEFVGNGNQVKRPVLTSSTNSAVTGLAPLISLIMYKNYGPNPHLNPNIEDESNKQCIAGVVEGNFESHFKNRIVDAFAKNPEIDYKEKSIKEGKVFVVGNGSFIANKYDSILDKNGQYLYRARAFNELKMDETMASLNMQPIVYGNQEFFQNMVDYMMGDNSVLDVRSRQIDIHAIDKEKVKVEASYYKFINMLLPSAIVVVLAAIIFFIRKRKYTGF